MPSSRKPAFVATRHDAGLSTAWKSWIRCRPAVSNAHRVTTRSRLWRSPCRAPVNGPVADLRVVMDTVDLEQRYRAEQRPVGGGEDGERCVIRTGPVTAIPHPRLCRGEVGVGSVDRVPPGDCGVEQGWQDGRCVVCAPRPKAQPRSLKLGRFHTAQRGTSRSSSGLVPLRCGRGHPAVQRRGRLEGSSSPKGELQARVSRPNRKSSGGRRRPARSRREGDRRTSGINSASLNHRGSARPVACPVTRWR